MTGSARMDDEQYLANKVSEVSLLENHQSLNQRKSKSDSVAHDKSLVLTIRARQNG